MAVAPGRPWTERDDAALTGGWRLAVSVAALCRLLNRSEGAVLDRLPALNLGRIPPGWATMEAAAEAGGVNPRTMARLCERARVEVRRSYPAKPGDGRSPIVRLAEALEALRVSVVSLETLNAGARARDLRPTTLGVWLESLGLHRLGRGRRRSALRFPSVVLDVAAAWGRAGGQQRRYTARRLSRSAPVRAAGRP